MRDFCYRCRKAQVTCYCARLTPFEYSHPFVILVHPREARNSVGTGRMLHLSMPGSQLIEGHDFTHNSAINSIIKDPSLHPVLLYPSPSALNLNTCTPDEAHVALTQKRLALIIVDGTWDLARGMINRSPNLKALPQLKFVPIQPSRFEIRKQPAAHCLSTLETAHWLIERFAELGVAPLPEGRAHDGLLDTFMAMIKEQVAFAAGNKRRTVGLRVGSAENRP